MALKAGPWFSYVGPGDADVRLSDHRMHCLKPTKSAGEINKASVAPAAASADSAGAAADGEDDD